MKRIPAPNPDDMSLKVKEIVDRANLNALKMYSHATPEVFKSFFELSSALFTSSALPAELRQLAILRIARISASEYVRRQHAGLALEAGISEETIASLDSDTPALAETLSPIQRATLDFTNEFITQIKVSDATLANMRHHINDNQLMDLMILIGTYMLMSRIIETSGVELEAHRLDTSKLSGLLNSDVQ